MSSLHIRQEKQSKIIFNIYHRVHFATRDNSSLDNLVVTTCYSKHKEHVKGISIYSNSQIHIIIKHFDTNNYGKTISCNGFTS